MPFERARRVLSLKHPLIEMRLDAAEAVHFGHLLDWKERFRFGQKNFARPPNSQFIAQARLG